MSDLLKAFSSGGFVGLLSWIFPSALTLGLFWLVVYPQINHSLHFFDSLTVSQKTGIFVAASIAIGLALDAMSTPLYRFLEGYAWAERWQNRGVKKQRALKASLQKKLNGRGWRVGLIYEKLSRFPIDDSQIAPTRLGNALRSFETYGSTRYNLDSQTLWTELCSVVPKYLQDELDRSRASVDFFVGLFYLTILFAVATLSFSMAPSMNPQLLLTGIMALLTLPIWYRMAVVSSTYWSSTVQSLVNLGRKKLAEEMGLRIPGTLAEERKMWGLVTSFVFFGDRKEGQKLNKYRVSANRTRTRTPAR